MNIQTVTNRAEIMGFPGDNQMNTVPGSSILHGRVTKAPPRGMRGGACSDMIEVCPWFTILSKH
ncbi:hypothetical protein TH2_10004 [Thalassospira profundimaris WP0211]|nr:hypothetical protein TH2_10004 [Thalassospira profundimaris WP0211]